MVDEIKGSVAEAVAAVEADLRNADKARAVNLYAQELRSVDKWMDALVASLDIAGLSSGWLTPQGVADAIGGHVKDVKARLTEQVRLRVLAEARAVEAEKQVDRLERAKVDLCTASLQDTATSRAKIGELEHQLRNAREDANIAGQECERLQARLAAVEAAAEQAAAAAVRPAWGEGTIEIDFADLCPEYDKGPWATADHVVPQIRLDAFGFVPGGAGRMYYVAAAERPDGAPLRGWNGPVGPRTSTYFVYIGDMRRRLPALHIRNAPPSYTPIHALVMAMERRDREAAEEQRDREAAAAKKAAAEADAEAETAAAVAEALAAEAAREREAAARGLPRVEPTRAWRLSPALVERLPAHLHNLRLVARKLRVTPPDYYICQGDNDLYWLVEHGERCGENPAWGEGERQIIRVLRCDAAGDRIPSGEFHATRYPVALLPVVIPA